MSVLLFEWDCEAYGEPLSPLCPYWDDIDGCCLPSEEACPYRN